MATGSGKTEVAFEILRRSISRMPDIKIMFIVNRTDLLNQTYARIQSFVDKVGIYCGSENRKELSETVTIATIQSIFSVDIDKVHLVIIDEAHNVDQKQGMYFKFLEKAKEKNSKLKIVALTATPWRNGYPIYGDFKLFQKICFEKNIASLITEGYLAPPTIKAPDHQFDISKLRVKMGEYVGTDVDQLTMDRDKAAKQVSDAIARLVGRKKVVWACSSIKHCELVADLLYYIDEDATYIHSKMDDSYRKGAKKFFEEGSARHMAFVSVLSEGYDFAPIDAIVLLRPIRSITLAIQVIGRGLRISEGKNDCLVLDYGRVMQNLGPLTDPNVMEVNRYGKNQKTTPIKICPKCREYLHAKCTRCIACGYEYQVNIVSKNTTLTPDANKNIFEISDILFDRHLSNNGNECLRIRYVRGILDRYPIAEYFKWDSEFAQKKLNIRLEQLGCKHFGDIKHQINAKISKIPKYVEIEKKNGYNKIKRLIYE